MPIAKEDKMLRGKCQSEWPYKYVGDVENAAVDSFLTEVIEVCRKHGMSISHEDRHGSFEVVAFNDGDVDWLMCATDKTETA
jgi:hypothetical protein